MWTLVTSQALATLSVDFPRHVSPLLVGLASVGWCAAGMLVFAALQHFLTQKNELRVSGCA